MAGREGTTQTIAIEAMVGAAVATRLEMGADPFDWCDATVICIGDGVIIQSPSGGQCRGLGKVPFVYRMTPNSKLGIGGTGSAMIFVAAIPEIEIERMRALAAAAKASGPFRFPATCDE